MTALPARRLLGGAAWVRVAPVAVVLVAIAAALSVFATTDRTLLRRIAQACVANSELTGAAWPCLTVDLPEGEAGGYVIYRAPLIHDAVLVPTRRIAGIESPVLYAPDAPNYFADAWRARALVRTPDGSAPDRDRLLLVVNSAVVRTQDQLHIHMGCLKPEVRRRLDALAPDLPVGAWRLVNPLAPHQPFWLLRLGQPDLEGVDPFQVAFQFFRGVVDDPGKITLAVVGASIDGADDLVILASYAGAPGSWWPVGAESLLDSRCRPEPPPDDEGARAERPLRASGT